MYRLELKVIKMMTDEECEVENLKAEIEALKKKVSAEQERRRFAEKEVSTIKKELRCQKENS